MSTDKTTPPTPGPWHLERDGNEQIGIVTPQGGMVLATILLSDGTGCGSDDERTDEEFNAEMEAIAHLLASSWDFAAACTAPDGTSRLSSLAYILDRYEALQDRAGVKETKTDKEARETVQDLLRDLRAAVAKSQGREGQTT